MTDITQLACKAGFIPSEFIGNFVGDRDNFAKLEQLLRDKFIAELGESVGWIDPADGALYHYKLYDTYKPLYALKDERK